MPNILSIIVPVFAIIGTGYFLAKRDFLPKDSLPVLSKLVLFCLIPALNFGTIARMKLEDVLVWDFLGVYAIGALLAQLVAVLVFKGWFGNSTTEAAIKALGVSMPNSIFVGFPVVTQAFGPEWGHTFMFAVIIENIVILPSVLIMAELGNSQHGKGANLGLVLTGILQRLFRNPIIISMTLGLMVSASGLSLPEAISKPLSVLGSAAPALALLVIGGSLVGTEMRGNLRELGTVSAIKLLVHPLMIVLVLLVWPAVDPMIMALLIVYAALPSAAIFPIIGGQYGQRDFCASSLALTTLASFFSLALVLSLVLTLVV